MSQNALLRISRPKHRSVMTSMTFANSSHRSVCRIPFRSISSMTPYQNHMKSISNPRSQQSSNNFSTSTTKMSDTNKNFLLSNVFNVKGKVALVTGGGSGIGLMATQALAVNGAKVYIVGRTEEKLENVVNHHGQNIEGEIIPIVADVTRKDEIAREMSLHCILINNAGISGATQQTEAKTAEEMKKNLFDDESSTFDDWCNTYRTNVPQLFFMTTAFLPLLQKASDHQYGYSGTVINISSISGIVQSSQHHFGYNASKAAAIHLTKMLSSEIAGNGLKIRVNSIAPGVFPSEMTTGGESGQDQKSHIEKEKYEKVPAKRPGKDEDMAGAILFAATNQYLNGQTVAVDGGYILHAGA
ncbi:putative short chain dehydrogenase reductase family protein [Botrytis fragariae]|uniref:Putative short chain dehydrogenase reductase family protein n=1 Tax=Botrytis fragariae TaxID=1964551 RepID=A0A8H6AVF2_9HELO|nr:putative short chain dehydrogenase reductase family protein [Botrytis fragariae]KAF5874347.1 putative short chain dehydrogenase reductase family protein [Botrytis fragariae]